jgi:hypothetical protein
MSNDVAVPWVGSLRIHSFARQVSVPLLWYISLRPNGVHDGSIQGASCVENQTNVSHFGSCICVGQGLAECTCTHRFCFQLAMVVAARIAYIRSRSDAGDAVRIALSSGVDTDKVKVFISEAVGRVDLATSHPLTRNALHLLEDAATQSVIVDRGHRHSSGVSETSFWIKKLPFAPRDVHQMSGDAPAFHCHAWRYLCAYG